MTSQYKNGHHCWGLEKNNFAIENVWRLNFNAWLYLVEDARFQISHHLKFKNSKDKLNSKCGTQKAPADIIGVQ